MSLDPRVLLITPDYPPARGGIQYLLAGVVGHATRVRFRVLTFADEASITQENSVQIWRVSTTSVRGGTIAALNAAALAQVRRFRPDVVLSGHIVAAPAARIAVLGGIPFVQYLYAKEMAHRTRLTSFAVRHATASIVLGEHGRSLALAAGAEPHRVHAIPPGIDLPARAASTPRDRKPVIVCVARLEDRYKGFDVLVRALPLIRSRVPEATMIFVGGGHLQPVLEALARANGCSDALRCTGRVDDAERDTLLASATVFAMPSRLRAGSGGEGFGIVYLEAGAHGTPVVAGNVGGALDAVVDGETGLLVTPEDHVALAEAITRLLLDRDLATRLGDGGREWAERFAWSKIVPKVEDVLIAAARGMS
ncbi:MAG: phosphatidyl-myo-inositol dimannoside synthase [Solirubrobacteraceae bacterium]|jgi:phosphatidylinositol alpha-1,6-mannosyltransferase|nr:phosphatidyl-myo-inositol dimannoside synthase [Solirubrobacteraceae bacterium]